MLDQALTSSPLYCQLLHQTHTWNITRATKHSTADEGTEGWDQSHLGGLGSTPLLKKTTRGVTSTKDQVRQSKVNAFWTVQCQLPSAIRIFVWKVSKPLLWGQECCDCRSPSIFGLLQVGHSWSSQFLIKDQHDTKGGLNDCQQPVCPSP